MADDSAAKLRVLCALEHLEEHQRTCKKQLKDCWYWQDYLTALALYWQAEHSARVGYSRRWRKANRA